MERVKMNVTVLVDLNRNVPFFRCLSHLEKIRTYFHSFSSFYLTLSPLPMKHSCQKISAHFFNHFYLSKTFQIKNVQLGVFNFLRLWICHPCRFMHNHLKIPIFRSIKKIIVHEKLSFEVEVSFCMNGFNYDMRISLVANSIRFQLMEQITLLPSP